MQQQQAGQWNGGGMQSGSMPVIQSVSSLAGTGELPARPDRLPTEPVPQVQIQQQVQVRYIKYIQREFEIPTSSVFDCSKVISNAI